MISTEQIKKEQEMNRQKAELRIAIKKLGVSLRALILLTAPFIISFYIWGVYMNPVSYLERGASIIFGFITVCGIFVIELSLFP